MHNCQGEAITWGDQVSHNSPFSDMKDEMIETFGGPFSTSSSPFSDVQSSCKSFIGIVSYEGPLPAKPKSTKAKPAKAKSSKAVKAAKPAAAKKVKPGKLGAPKGLGCYLLFLLLCISQILAFDLCIVQNWAMRLVLVLLIVDISSASKPRADPSPSNPCTGLLTV